MSNRAAIRRYQNLGNQAVASFQNGNYRASADNYLAALRACPDKNELNRWQIFTGFTSIVLEKYFPPSLSDIEALLSIKEDKKESRLFRVEASRTAGLLRWDLGERVEAAELYRSAIRLGEKVTEKERREKVLASISPDGNPANLRIGMQQVGELVDNILDEVRRNLRVLESPQGNMRFPGTHYRSDGTVMPPDVRATVLLSGLSGPSIAKEEYDRLISVGGDACDCCKKTLAELKMHHLKQCGRCLKAFYCSAECQNRQWRGGHKKVCRKPGHFKSGDFIKLQGIESKPELNGSIVKVVGPDPDKEGRWAVKADGGTRSISVAAEKMVQLRPLV